MRTLQKFEKLPINDVEQFSKESFCADERRIGIFPEVIDDRLILYADQSKSLGHPLSPGAETVKKYDKYCIPAVTYHLGQTELFGWDIRPGGTQVLFKRHDNGLWLLSKMRTEEPLLLASMGLTVEVDCDVYR